MNGNSTDALIKPLHIGLEALDTARQREYNMDTIPEYDGRADRRTNRRCICHVAYASTFQRIILNEMF